MANFNRLILAGRLTRAVELRYTANGKPVGNAGLAVNRKWRDDAGDEHEETLFVDFVVWGKMAETLVKYTSKGSGLLIEGALKLETWENDGEKRSKLVAVVESFQFLDSKKSDNGADSPRAQQSKPAAKPQMKGKQ